MAHCWLKLLSLIMLSFCLGNSSCGQKNGQAAEVVDGKEMVFSSCKEDNDCTQIKADCCGCNQGGAQVAVNKSEAKSLLSDLKNKCQDTMCAQVISDHESCSQEPRCLNHQCQLAQ